MDHRKLLIKRIQSTDIPTKMVQELMTRLKVANCAGVAHVERDFEQAVAAQRVRKLQSHRRHSQGLPPTPPGHHSPKNKQAVTLDIA